MEDDLEVFLKQFQPVLRILPPAVLTDISGPTVLDPEGQGMIAVRAEDIRFNSQRPVKDTLGISPVIMQLPILDPVKKIPGDQGFVLAFQADGIRRAYTAADLRGLILPDETDAGIFFRGQYLHHGMERPVILPSYGMADRGIVFPTQLAVHVPGPGGDLPSGKFGGDLRTGPAVVP